MVLLPPLPLFACLINFKLLLSSAGICYSYDRRINESFSKKSLRNSIRVSNSLDPDQDRHCVGPDLGPNCLQRLSAGNKVDTSMKKLHSCTVIQWVKVSRV